MADLPDDVITAQRTMDRAWATLETYRKAVDAARRADAQDTKDALALRSWNDQENAEYDRLHAAALAAAEARAIAMTANGIRSGFATEFALREAARAIPAVQGDAPE
jgi:hypothetical protein